MLEKFWTPYMKKITIEQKWVIKYKVKEKYNVSLEEEIIYIE